MNKDDFVFEEFTLKRNECNFCLWESNNIVITDNKPCIDFTLRQFINFLIFPKQKEDKSIGSSINSMASTVYYNLLSKHKKLNLSNVTKVNIYDKSYSGTQMKQRIQNALSSIILMTYRNGMNAIHNISTGDYFNTDCGWGCTIRSAQMMLAKAIIELKKFDFSIKNNKDAEFMDIIAFKEETIALFADNNIPTNIALKLKDFDWIFKEITKLYLNQKKEPLDFRNDINEPNKFEIKSPFSIRTICHFTKNVGKWSNVMIVIQSLIKISKYAYSDITMIHYPNGVISELELFNSFCNVIPCTCGNPFQLLQDNDNDAKSDEDNTIPLHLNKENCVACSSISNNKHDGNIIKYNNQIYRFTNKGIIFVTVRLGLKYLENGYVEDVKNILKIPNNIGLIGGKADRAFYFIGYFNNVFICLDPHFNQDAIDIADNDFISYRVNNLYMIKPSEMSPEITFGILITKGDDFSKCLSSLKEINKEFIFIK